MVNETRKIQSVERAMYVLERMAAAGGRLRLAELVACTGLNKSTLHGLLNTLAALGYVAREGRCYVLGLRLREVAQVLSDEDERLRRQFRGLVAELHARWGENVYLAVPCGTREYLYIDFLGDGDHFRGVSPRGRREGLTTSAMGKVFLANIDEMARSLRRAEKLPPALWGELCAVRRDGFALDLEVAEPGLNAFAIPLRLNGRTVAGVSVAGPAERLPPERLVALARQAMSLVRV
ncbi:MAG: helix-turn-helix domain-containing protein [Lautropia sp.]|nr:helix-turn-helix domain-containing protein [Lautropia sp.]